MPLAALVLGTLAAWVAFVRLGMASAGLVAFLVGWVVMMTAMMLPSAAPLVLVYGPRGRGRLILGYLLMWALVGLPVYAIARAVDLMMVPAAAVAAVLVGAAAYQFTHIKTACLRACRSPLDFIAMRWGRGPFRLGVEHGGSVHPGAVLPEGLVCKEASFGTSLTFKVNDAIEYDHSGKYTAIAPFEYSAS